MGKGVRGEGDAFIHLFKERDNHPLKERE